MINDRLDFFFVLFFVVVFYLIRFFFLRREFRLTHIFMIVHSLVEVKKKKIIWYYGNDRWTTTCMVICYKTIFCCLIFFFLFLGLNKKKRKPKVLSQKKRSEKNSHKKSFCWLSHSDPFVVPFGCFVFFFFSFSILKILNMSYVFLFYSSFIFLKKTIRQLICESFFENMNQKRWMRAIIIDCKKLI